MSGPRRVIVMMEGRAATGGAERVALATVDQLSKRGIPVTVINTKSGLDEPFASLPGVDHIGLDQPVYWDRYFNSGKAGMLTTLHRDPAMHDLVSQKLRQFDPAETLIHVHEFHNSLTHSGVVAALDAGFCTVLTGHDYGLVCPNSMFFDYETNVRCPERALSLGCLRRPCMGAAARRLKTLRFARLWAFHRLNHGPKRLATIIAVSNFERDILRQYLPASAPVEVARNPVRPASEGRQPAESSTQWLWVGRMNAEKDPITPLAAAANVGIQMTMVGDGPLLETLRAAHPGHVFTGWQSADAVAELQARSRALVMTSITYETASLVVLEALAAGIPCLVPKGGAAAEWVEHGVNGLHFEAGDSASLAAAMEHLQDPQTVQKMSQAAHRRFWESPFTEEAYGDRVIEIYEKAWGRKHR